MASTKKNEIVVGEAKPLYNEMDNEGNMLEEASERLHKLNDMKLTHPTIAVGGGFGDQPLLSALSRLENGMKIGPNTGSGLEQAELPLVMAQTAGMTQVEAYQLGSTIRKFAMCKSSAHLQAIAAQRAAQNAKPPSLTHYNTCRPEDVRALQQEADAILGQAPRFELGSRVNGIVRRRGTCTLQASYNLDTLTDSGGSNIVGVERLDHTIKVNLLDPPRRWPTIHYAMGNPSFNQTRVLTKAAAEFMNNATAETLAKTIGVNRSSLKDDLYVATPDCVARLVKTLLATEVHAMLDHQLEYLKLALTYYAAMASPDGKLTFNLRAPALVGNWFEAEDLSHNGQIVVAYPSPCIDSRMLTALTLSVSAFPGYVDDEFTWLGTGLRLDGHRMVHMLIGVGAADMRACQVHLADELSANDIYEAAMKLAFLRGDAPCTLR